MAGAIRAPVAVATKRPTAATTLARREARRAQLLATWMAASSEVRDRMAADAARARAFQGLAALNEAARYTVTDYPVDGLGEAGGLPAATVAAMRKIVDDVNAAADRAEALQPGVFSRAWSNLIGAESSASALVTAAKAQRSLATAVSQRVDRILAANDVDAAASFLADAKGGGWTDLRVIEEAASLLQPTTGVAIVAKDTAKDIGTAAAAAGQGTLVVVKWLPYIALGIGALAAWRFLSRTGDRVADRVVGLLPSTASASPAASPLSGWRAPGEPRARRRRRARRNHG